jgi:lipopolysaccharide heptosyltransferase II
LILKPSSLGDVIQSIPVLRLLRRRFPHAHIAWWVDASLVELLKGDPDLDEVIPFHRQALRRFEGVRTFVHSVLQMRRSRYDWVLDLQGLLRSGTVGWVANGGLTIGVDDPREGAAAFYDLAVLRPAPTAHAVDWYLSVLRRLKVPVDVPFEWLPRRPEVAARVQERWQPGDRPWICLQPGARWWNKRWPVEHYEQVIQGLGARHLHLGFAVLGGRGDEELGRRMAGALPGRTLDLTGRLSLLEMIEWLRLSSVMVTNDTGPMHAAAALGIPVVGLFGPTDPRRTGPYGQLASSLRLGLPCSPCLKQRCSHARPLECLQAIPPSGVIDAVERHLKA